MIFEIMVYRGSKTLFDVSNLKYNHFTLPAVHNISTIMKQNLRFYSTKLWNDKFSMLIPYGTFSIYTNYLLIFTPASPNSLIVNNSVPIINNTNNQLTIRLDITSHGIRFCLGVNLFHLEWRKVYIMESGRNSL